MVLHIAGFITICEAFLRMEPHADFFRWLFSRRALMVMNSSEVAPVGVSPCRGNRAREAHIPRTSPTILVEGGMGNGSISGTQWRRRSRHSPKGGRRGGRASCGGPPVSRTSWRSLRRSSRSWCSTTSMGCGCSTPSSAIESPHWWRGGGRCGTTPAQWILTTRPQRSW